MKAVYLVDEIGLVVQAASIVLGQDINYLHGHPKEILNTLSEQGKSKSLKYKKYPLVALFQDFGEEMGETVGAYASTSLNLVICTSTEAHYTSGQRYEKNFKPVLYPIYEEFLKQLHASKAFDTLSAAKIRHRKTDRLFWGRNGLYGNDGNIFNDRIDAIEIENLNLKVNLKNC